MAHLLQVPLFQTPLFQLVLWSIVKATIILMTMLGLVSYTIYVERKVAGHIQWRPGPNRVGPFGLFQPLADIGKLFFKEEFWPADANKVVFFIAPMLAVIPAITTFAVIPFGPGETWRGTDVNVGLLVFLAMSSLGVYAITLAGWSSNNKYALLGGLRSSAQMISYELAMGLSTIPAVLLAGTLSLAGIVDAQAKWTWLDRAFLVVPFVVFIITALAETNRAPFDLPEAEGELVAGFHTEYSSMKWGLFFLGEYMNMFAISSVAITLFLGGWRGPGPESLGFVWYMVKLVALMLFFIHVRWTFPRLRYDQLMNLGWKGLLPLSLANVVVVSLYVYWKLHA